MVQLVRNYLRRYVRRDDHAVSPVIGTILMVAVTVVLGVAVYAAVSGFGNRSVKEPTSAVFVAKAVDTDGNGKTDTLKISYISGPSGLTNGTQVVLKLKDTAGTSINLAGPSAGTWSPGDFVVYDPGAARSFLVTVAVNGNTVVDHAVATEE